MFGFPKEEIVHTIVVSFLRQLAWNISLNPTSATPATYPTKFLCHRYSPYCSNRTFLSSTKIEQDVLLKRFCCVAEMDSADPGLAEIQSKEWQERFVPYQDFVQKHLPAAATGKGTARPIQ
ncbi:MAG: hypothetical protein R2788_21200 [Saprospiraceae bacterium]